MTTSASALGRVCALVLASATGVARAADAPEAPVRIEVRAAPSCTSESDLRARVSARLPRVRYGEDPAALVVRARFTISPSGNVTSDLTMSKPGGASSSRRLVARSCAQAADAVALIVAVTVDPTVATKAGVPLDVSSTDSAIVEPPEETQGPAKKAPEGEPTGVPAQSGPSETHPSPWARGTLRFGAGVAATAIFGVAPGVMPGVTAYGILGLDRDAVLSPAIVLAVTHAWKTGVEATGGIADFALDAASIDACPFRLHVSSVEARACASALVGRLGAEGRDTFNAPGTIHRLFATAGAAVTLAVRPHPLVEFWARSAGEVNLTRDSFEFSTLVFHRVDALSFSMSLGIGLRSR